MSIPGSNVFPGWGQGGPPARRRSSVVGRWSRLDLRRLAPARWFPARPRAGARLSLEESRRKEHQGQAPGPRFYSRSLPLAGFGDGCLWNGRRAISSDILRPIWDAFFEGKYAEKHFMKESPQIRARNWLQMKITSVPLRSTTPKRASGNERAIKKGGRGASPRDSLRPGFL